MPEISRELLTEAELSQARTQLPGWEVSGEVLRRTYEFENFVAAFGFMAQAALCAERLDHHPDWSNVYRTVNVSLNTHDRGGVTHLDVELATQMELIASGLIQP